MDKQLLYLLLLLCLHPCIQASHLKYQVLHVAPFQAKHQPVYAQDASMESLQWTQTAHDDIKGASLTMKLLHRDSPSSPLKNPHANPQELFKERLTRDAARARALSMRANLALNVGADVTKEEAIDEFTGQLMAGSGEYLTRLSMGTPPRKVSMLVDTGSDINWLQCAPCASCYEQTDPIYNPTSSSSYRRLACTSPMCRMLQNQYECGSNYMCMYKEAFGDGSFIEGEFSMEAVSFGESSMKSVAMGCAHNHRGHFTGAAGIVGLGGGPLSFPSQMASQFGKIFSYCLIDRYKAGYSTLIFGNVGIPKGTLFTPLLRNPNLKTYYYVPLSGISVGGNMLSIAAEAFEMDIGSGSGVIVDSGTVITWLVQEAYGALSSAFQAATTSLPTGYSEILETCYDLSGVRRVEVPTLSFHFEGGAEMVLPATNYVIPVDNYGTYCLAFGSAGVFGDGLSIIGNIQQQGFRVIYDGVSSRFGFAPNQC